MRWNPRHGPERSARDPEWSVYRTLLLVLGLWASLWAAGELGGVLGGARYDSTLALAPPYTPAQIDGIARVAPGAALLVELQLRAWEREEAIGRDLAVVEGQLVGTVSAVVVWALWGGTAVGRGIAGRRRSSRLAGSGRRLDLRRAAERAAQALERRRSRYPGTAFDRPDDLDAGRRSHGGGKSERR